MTTAETYHQTSEDVVRTYRRIHGNGEQTHVVIMSVGDRDYAAVAYDIDPSEFSEGHAETIAYDPTIEGVVERAERWMERNPKGVLQSMGGGEDDSGGGKTWERVKAMAGKLNEYGNEQRKQMQHNQQGGGKQ